MRFDHTFAALVLVVITGLGFACFTREPPPTAAGTAALSGVLGDDADALAGYERVTGPRRFRFPDDHGAHPDYRSEWWYFVGNLRGEDGRDYGFQLTFFRFALAPPPGEPRRSDWATRQAWMAHFAVTDPAGGAHHVFERFQRGGALGLAGASTPPPRVWLDDWVMAADGAALFPLRLRATADGVGIDLRIDAVKPLVLQGDDGYSPKSEQPGNASHYYSYTRLKADGELTLPGDEGIAVAGSAWLDREWSTSALADDQAGWDWFALQLDDGRELMVYRMRRHDGGTDPASAGVLVDVAGATRRLGIEDFGLEVLRRWTSPRSGARYPVAWRVEVPAAGLDLIVEARMDAQEMTTAFRYWEGPVVVRDAPGDGRPRGRGYLEMTGYPGRE